MDYSQLHDAQINMMVCKALGHELSSYARIIMQDDATILLSDNKTLVDYCNNPADAWPIIESNLIALKPVPIHVGGHRWFATKGSGDFGGQYSDRNPLRAAMVIFLIMQERNNA